MPGARLDVEALTMRYGSAVALAGVDLAIAAGSYVVILGPSGSGKTTLLSILGGFTRPTAGRVLVDGEDVTAEPPARRPTTTVFQDYALFPHMSVGGNVAFGLRMRRVSGAERRRRVAGILELVGLPGTESRRVQTLSGGQRQRVALARALVVGPPVVLLDEPLGALDMKLRRQMQDELTRIQRMTGTTFVHVTHDQEEAMALADSVVLLDRGRIADQGHPQRVYLRPSTPFAARFMGEGNLLDGAVVERGAADTVVETAIGRLSLPVELKGDRVTICIRPEHVRPDRLGTLGLGEARLVEGHFVGTHQRWRLALEGTELLVYAPPALAWEAGMTVQLSCDPADVIVLTATGDGGSPA
jgi:spermidine/putrescine transport system ATP-binding protein